MNTKCPSAATAAAAEEVGGSKLSKQCPKHFNGSFSFTNRFMMMSLPCQSFLCVCACVCVFLWSLHNTVNMVYRVYKVEQVVRHLGGS